MVIEVDDSGLKKAQQRLQATREKLDAAANQTAVAGAALTAGLFAVGRSVLQFERSMNNLQAATNETSENMAILRKEAQRMGRTTKFSASQAADAQVELGRAGFDTAKIIATLPNVLSLAAAGNLSMAESAGIVTSAMAGFQLEADQSQRITDVLAAAAASAKTDVSAMGFALSKVAPIASKLNISIEQTSAALAVLQDNGQSAEIAGTGLRGVLAKLINPSNDARKAMARLGVNSRELAEIAGEGNLTGVMEILGQAGLDTASAFKIFGQESATQAVILAGAIPKIRQLETSYEGAGGAAERMANQQMAGLPGAIDTLLSKFEGLLLALGDAGVTAAIIKMSDFLGQLIDRFQNADPVIQKIIAGALTLGPALIGLAGILKLVSGVVGVFNALLFANPIGLIIAAVAALIAALGVLYAYWDEVVASFKAGFDLVGGILDDVGDFFGLGGDDNGRPPAPGAGAPAVAGGGGVTQNTISPSIGQVHINAPGADSREIAANINTQMRDQFRNAAQNFDSEIAR